MAILAQIFTLPRRWLRRYKFLFIIGILFLLLQIFLAYKSFKIPILNSNDYISNKNLRSISPINNNKNKLSESGRKSGVYSNNKQSFGLNFIIDDEDIHSNSNLYSKFKIKENSAALLENNINNNHNNINNNNNNNNIKNNLNKKSNLRLDDLNFIPPCDIVAREAISAIHRAKTQDCKLLLAKTACDIQNGLFYPNLLPNFCPNDNFIPNKFLGCFKDEKNYRILSGYYTNFKSANSPKKCIQMCLQSGFLYAGLQYSTECFCGNEKPPVSAKLADPSCNMKCPGNPKQACGGFYTINIYETGISKFAPQIAETVPKLGEESVRIAFLLTLTGRAIRQVHRLLKSLYHPRHYFYIHVDARQDYLYRELLPLEKKYSNIKLTHKRYSTIWGGASLLTMLLNSMEELLLNKKWHWDFVINLSESDFPVKTLDKLVDFLTANKYNNFVKSHGREVQRFIQKQGLDKTFVECDTHMWRIGDRELPDGIQIDGGSDWIALSRDFVQYITKNTDDLIDGLLKIFQHTLLPAESFFHTVLRNSKFCKSYIDNNLHVTNWKRRLGCKCQYKHVVDWCGCSPNDFKPDDWPRLEATETKQVFFARKFEAVINQAVLLKLEEWLNGPYPSDFLNLNKYWQSIYHRDDKSPIPEDSLLTIVTSLVRLNSISLNYIPKNIIEVTSFYEDDHYKGFLILHDGQIGTSDNILIQTFIKPTQIAKSSVSSSLGKRIRSLEVSTDFDQKEQISRNFAKMLGPTSEPVLIFRLAASQSDNQTNFNITVLWIDSTGSLTSVDDYHIEDGPQASTNFIKPILKAPLTPGVWTVKILHRKIIIAHCRFLITPLQFIAKDEITQKQAEKFNFGSNYDQTLNLNHPEYSTYLIPETERLNFIQKSLSDSKRIGLDLQNWIDNLVSNFFSIKKTCVHYNKINNINNNLSNYNNLKTFDKCIETTWSSFIPDPKSDVSDLNKT